MPNQALSVSRQCRRLAPILAAIAGLAGLPRDAAPARLRMSFDNRLLLNRAVVSGLRTLEVLVLAKDAASDRDTVGIAQLVTTLAGRDVAKIAGIVNSIDPALPDDSRVYLDTMLEADRSWARIGGRTYVLPHPGRYRVGMFEVPAGANAVHRFAVAEDESTHDV